MAKLLSVIVPVYGVEAYLSKCVDSILAQTYPAVEVILIDDGSPDGCPAICDKYAKMDDRVTVIHQKNAGQGPARNAGLDIARGEYIAFVDGDDYIDKDMYAVMIEALERTDSDIAFCGFVSHSGIRDVQSCSFAEEYVWENAEALMRGLFLGEAPGNPVNKVCRRELFADLRYPAGVAREDVYIMHTLYGKVRRAVHTGQAFYHYIIREGSSEHRAFNPRFLISIEIADHRRDYVKENFPALLPLAEISCYGSRISAIKKIVRSDGEKEYAETLAALKRYLRENEPKNKVQRKDRRHILYFPWLYKLRMNVSYKWRKKLKNLALKLKKK